MIHLQKIQIVPNSNNLKILQVFIIILFLMNYD